MCVGQNQGSLELGPYKDASDLSKEPLIVVDHLGAGEVGPVGGDASDDAQGSEQFLRDFDLLVVRVESRGHGDGAAVQPVLDAVDGLAWKIRFRS